MKNKIYHSVFLIVALVLVIVWFWDGKQIATGEESFSIFNERDIWELNGLVAQGGTGFANPTYLPRIPLSLLVRGFLVLSIPLWVSQALIFFLFILSGLYGMFYVTRAFVGDEHPHRDEVSFFAALFYLCNLYTMSQVWGRFLYASIGVWAYMPILFFVWMKWIGTKDKRWLLAICASTFVFSICFVQPGSILTLFAPIGVWTLVSIFKKRKEYSAIWHLIVLSLFAGTVFVVSSLWWLYPFVRLGGETFSTVVNSSGSFDSLRGVSPSFTYKEILVLKQAFLFNPQVYFGWYHTAFSHILSFFVLVLVVSGLWKSRGLKSGTFLIVLFFVGYFVVKGSNPPLGHVFFQNLFTYIPATQALRNPYEKFGVVFLFPYAIFFGIGFVSFLNKLQNSLVRYSVCAICSVLFLGVLPWPIWTGQLYGGAISNTRVTIPQYYEDLNNYLGKDKDSNRILILPINPGDGIQLRWKHGFYRGIDPSEYLIDKEPVSKIFRAKYFDDKYLKLYESFIDFSRFRHFLQEMNIKYLLVNYDTVIDWSKEVKAQDIEKTIVESPLFAYEKNFGNLHLYSFKEYQPRGLFIAEGENVPSIKYNQIGVNRYKVKVMNAHTPYALIFKSTYSKFWQARIGDQEIQKHDVVYEYANRWRIDKKGSYEIDVYFSF